MKRFFRIKPWLAYLIFVVLDLVCIGAGMGVPIFCIFFGFLVGWYIARRQLLSEGELSGKLRRILLVALATSSLTFAVMCILWGRTVPMLFNPTTDFANLGIPMILYDPKPSFIGWLVLMIFVSPFLQLLTTIFAAYLTITRRLRQSQCIR